MIVKSKNYITILGDLTYIDARFIVRIVQRMGGGVWKYTVANFLYFS